jgi:predicted CxxxxCH...CXXCH cytochrome family protein
VAVGAHQKHLRSGAIRAAIECDACHRVPRGIADHAGSGPRVIFGDLARAEGAAPAWDRARATCSGVYCHAPSWQGRPAAGGTRTAIVWTEVSPEPLACDACHGNPPGSHAAYGSTADCSGCHGGTVAKDGAGRIVIDVAGGKHLNGRPDFTGGGTELSCTLCHPDPGGAHAAHGAMPAADSAYGDLHTLETRAGPGALFTAWPSYDYGCGQCHPLEDAHHVDGTVDVDLSPAGAPAGSLKARNDPAARYDPAGGTCSGVYCHSSGQESPAFATSPGWRSSGEITCRSCHANPPRYPNGGAGASEANSHLRLEDDGYESGHFGGLPGPWHGSRHGLAGAAPPQDAAPITCQACHFETTDPESAGPSGFYWLDTSGDYQLPGGLLGYSCQACHTGAPGSPMAGNGKVLPLRHVNGRRDVIFDPRTSLPAIPWLPAAPDAPTRPYWVTHAAIGTAPPEGAGLDGSTLSIQLGGAGYDPQTKTCSSVGCHLSQLQITWGSPGACQGCHGF